MLNDQFFGALGRLTFAFAWLEDIAGLCIAELLPNPREKSALQGVWGLNTFKKKLERLKKEFAGAKQRAREPFDESEFDALLRKTIEVAHRRNAAVHGFLSVDPGTREWFLKNRRFPTKVSVNPAEIDDLTTAVQDLWKAFGKIRGDCISLREYLTQLDG